MSNYKYEICVIGLGYVGLPLILTAANTGMNCLGVDINESVISNLNDNISHIDGIDNNRLDSSKNNVSFVSDFSQVSLAESILLCVPTPLENGEPYTRYIDDVIESIKSEIREGQLLVLESTTYPGHTLDIKNYLENQTGLKVGEDFFMCFSPEREDPGNIEWNTKSIPKVVGGVTKKCTEKGVNFYSNFLDTVIPAKSSESAELSKLLENTQRLINIAFINEFKLICEKLNQDTNHVIDLALTKPFGFSEYRPGPGVGGHCIPIDPFYLQWKYQSFGMLSHLIEAAKKAEEANKQKIIDILSSHINQDFIEESEVVFVGLSYKKNISDIRSSVSYEIAKELNNRFSKINFFDPMTSSNSFNDINVITEISSLPSTFSTLIIMVNHDCIDFENLAQNAKYIFDTQNTLKHFKDKVITL